MKKSYIRILCFILALCLMLTSCGGNNADNNTSDGDGTQGGGDSVTHRVMLSYDSALVSVEGDNPVEVEDGGTATFRITIAEGYLFKACSEGSFDQKNGVLTVENVTERLNINFYVEEVGFDTSDTYVYIFNAGYSGDTTSVEEGSSVNSGTQITVRANDESRVFRGWTSGNTYSKGGKLLSTDREFTFRLGPDMVTDGILKLYSNYISTNTLSYDVNGGQINESSGNMTRADYYSTVAVQGNVTVTYYSKYLSFMECGSSFYDDGTFTRDGYILKEYNTAADGSGTAYSLGSKVPLISPDGENMKLYCIWAEATAKENFTYTDYTYPCPVNSKYAPDWIEQGVVITKYLGDEKEVVIPETIDGKYVIAIQSAAFFNKDIETLVMGRRMQRVYDGAFIGCGSLSTVYFPDSIYSINNEAFDSASYNSFKNLYVNATMAPRFVSPDTGALSVKLSRLLAPTDKPRIVVIAGSSSYQGLGTAYLEALLDGEYRVINFGTTRTTHGLMYLEAMQNYVDEDDTVIYAPENSSYMLGEGELYWKTLRDLEHMNNIFRYVDISGYTNVFDAFTELNQQYRYTMLPMTYEQVCENGAFSSGTTDKYGDYLHAKRGGYVGLGKYIDAYYITMNEYVKSKDEGAWNNVENQNSNKDYTDPNNITWANITLPYFKDRVNSAIDKVKATGAGVYFGYCPTDGSALIAGAAHKSWLANYDFIIENTYHFDGTLGSAEDYIWAHEYFYDCAFHTNDYGRTYRTYQLYVDLCELFGITKINGIDSKGTSFDGCLFEKTADGEPMYGWSCLE